MCVEDLQSVWICISGEMTARISAMLTIIGSDVSERRSVRLIDADETLMDAEHMSAFRCSLANMEDLNILIGGQETIDAVPVVRCEKCIHYEMGVCLKIYDDGAASRYAWQERRPDDFCSYGEKEGAD